VALATEPAARVSLRDEALADVRAAIDELLWVCESARRSLAQGFVTALALAAARRATAQLSAWTDELARLRATAAPVEALAREADRIAELVRVQLAIVGGLVTAEDWQSPSFAHSLRAQAGRYEGRIVPHETDYKRDRHLDATAYERAWLAEYADDQGAARAYLTSCGMAAFTTILGFLLFERLLDGPVVVGRSTYHESRILLRSALGARVTLVDEEDTDAVVCALAGRPRALFLDSLCNAPGLALPDLDTILAAVPDDCWVVVDNTCLGVECQPYASDVPRLIVYESLLKLAQLGLDRVTAGVIVARGPELEKLGTYREHLGTNIPDASVYALPDPNRKLLARRLARIERNAAAIAVRFPGAHHPGRGGLVQIQSSDPAAFVERAVREARRRDVQLVAGAGFGFDATRIYLTHAFPDEPPFLRVAAGAEHRLRAQGIAAALADAAE
jgi:Cys/Met metabolism PLP-dependent enzyme